MHPRSRLAALALVAATPAAFAQPKFIVTCLDEDIDSTGNKSLGRLVEWLPGPTAVYAPYVYERGVGYTRIPGTTGTPTMVRGSSNFTSLVMDLQNFTNWGDLNCFAGYCFGSMQDCTPGTPLPPPSPCWIPTVTHHWTASTGWVNAGSLARSLDPATGRFYGGTRCDGNINYPNDISGDGRYIVGGAWWAPLTTAGGGPGFGLCGNFYAFSYDAQTGAFNALPSASSSKTTSAHRVNGDGSVITGYDLGPVPDGSGGFYDGRRKCVWTNGVQSLLDPISNDSTISPVNAPGTVIAGFPSAAYNQATFGSGGIKLVRWVRQPDNSWTPQNLGRPLDRDAGLTIDILIALYPSAISDDGNTIIGTAVYNQLGPGGLSRMFIWRPTINAGKPIDLQDYIQSLDPSSPLLEPGLLLSYGSSMSSDGNAIAMRMYDGRDTCPGTAQSLQTSPTGILYLNGASVACDPPRIAVGPTDWVETQYTPFGIALNVSVSGSWPLSYQWQRELPGSPGSWVDLSDDCSNFDQSIPWAFEGTHTAQLRVGQAECGADRAGRYRVVVSNACGSVTSDPATVTFPGEINVIRQPGDTRACVNKFRNTSFAVLGSGPNTYQWQIAESGNFSDLYDGVWFTSDGRLIEFSGTDSQNLTLLPGALGGNSQYEFRCLIINPCDSETTESSFITICDADFNCDEFADAIDYDEFIAAWVNGDQSSDINADGFSDAIDYDTFISAWVGGC